MSSHLDVASLQGDQLYQFMLSPISEAELQRKAEIEQISKQASTDLARLELQRGEALAHLRDHPQQLWQRDEMFRTKRGGWKKNRSWHSYVVAHNLAESGKEADQLIENWRAA